MAGVKVSTPDWFGLSLEGMVLLIHEKTRELPGERDNARSNARCTQARKTTHGLDEQHQYVDRTPRGLSLEGMVLLNVTGQCCTDSAGWVTTRVSDL